METEGTLKLLVGFEVLVDLEAWRSEYGLDRGTVVDDVVADLQKPEWYLQQPKWDGLAKVNGRVTVDPVLPTVQKVKGGYGWECAFVDGYTFRLWAPHEDRQRFTWRAGWTSVDDGGYANADCPADALETAFANAPARWAAIAAERLAFAARDEYAQA